MKLIERTSTREKEMVDKGLDVLAGSAITR